MNSGLTAQEQETGQVAFLGFAPPHCYRSRTRTAFPGFVMRNEGGRPGTELCPHSPTTQYTDAPSSVPVVVSLRPHPSRDALDPSPHSPLNALSLSLSPLLTVLSFGSPYWIIPTSILTAAQFCHIFIGMKISSPDPITHPAPVTALLLLPIPLTPDFS